MPRRHQYQSPLRRPLPAGSATLIESHSDSGLSPETVTMAGWVREDLAAGKISSEQAAQIFDELGTPADQRAPDTCSAEVKQLDAHFPPAKESEFLLHLYPPGQAPAVIPKEVQSFEANLRAWMGPDGAGLSREQGNSIITTLSKAGQFMRGLSANEREHNKDNENAKLDKLYGPGWHDQLEPAKRMIHELDQKRPGLKAFVAAHGDNALFLTQLIQAARVYHARKGK